LPVRAVSEYFSLFSAILKFLKNLTPRRKVRYEPRGSRVLSRDSLATETNGEVESAIKFQHIKLHFCILHLTITRCLIPTTIRSWAEQRRRITTV
jgi:hypothetical protein